VTGIDRSPTRPGSVVAAVAALAALVARGAFSWPALGVATAGVALLGVGLAFARHDAVTVGGGLLFLAVLVAGLRGAPVVALLSGAVATVVAWDSAGTAIDLGAQLGRAAPTLRLELVHTGGTVLVGALAASVGWALFQLRLGTAPLTAPVLLLVAVLAITGALAVRSGRR
jgi:hypothetical protein